MRVNLQEYLGMWDLNTTKENKASANLWDKFYALYIANQWTNITK